MEVQIPIQTAMATPVMLQITPLTKTKPNPIIARTTTIIEHRAIEIIALIKTTATEIATSECSPSRETAKAPKP